MKDIDDYTCGSEFSCKNSNNIFIKQNIPEVFQNLSLVKNEVKLMIQDITEALFEVKKGEVFYQDVLSKLKEFYLNVDMLPSEVSEEMEAIFYSHYSELRKMHKQSMTSNVFVADNMDFSNISKNERMALESFKSEFLKLKKRFNEHREIRFLTTKEKGKFSTVLREEKGYIFIYFDEHIIEIYFNLEKFRKYFYQYPYFTIKNNPAFFIELLRQMALHEFGHLFLVRTSYGFLSRDLRNYILSKKGPLEDILDDPIVGELLSKSRDMLIDKRLKYIKYDEVTAIVRDFRAYYIWFNQLESKTPLEALEINSLEANETLMELSDLLSDISILRTILYKKVIRIIIKSQIFFIFNEWDLFRKIFLQFGLESLSKFCQEVNLKTLKIIKDHDSYDSMKEDIEDLAYFLDNNDFLNPDLPHKFMK